MNIQKINIKFDDTDYFPTYSVSDSIQDSRITIFGLQKKMWSPEEVEKAGVDAQDGKCWLYHNDKLIPCCKWKRHAGLEDNDKVEVYATEQTQKVPPVTPITIDTHAGITISAWWNRKQTDADPTDYTVRVNGLRVEPTYVLQKGDSVIVRKQVTA